MRTTFNIDDELLNAAKHEALRINATLSAVVIDVVRAGLRSESHAHRLAKFPSLGSSEHS